MEIFLIDQIPKFKTNELKALKESNDIVNPDLLFNYKDIIDLGNALDKVIEDKHKIGSKIDKS